MHAIAEMDVFLEVVRQGSFSAAARHLGIAPSVVADRVAGLEKRLGVSLLTRTTRRQSLTEVGATYYAEASQIVCRVQALERDILDNAASSRGVLRVTAPIPLGRHWIAPFIGQFSARYPEISIHLTLNDRFADIVGEGFDIAIRGGLAVDSTLIGHRLFETRRVIVASPEYIARHGVPYRPEDLAEHRCLVFNTEPHFHAEWRFGRGGAANSQRLTGVMATTSSELPVAWALAGLGLAQKSWWEVVEYVVTGRLVTVLDAFEPDPAVFYAIHPVSRAKSRKIALFLEELSLFLSEGLQQQTISNP